MLGQRCVPLDGGAFNTAADVLACNSTKPVLEFDRDAGMVVVPAGPFWRGCNDAVDHQCAGNERPGRCITLSGFELDEMEVTQASYAACVAAGACTRPSDCEDFRYDPVHDARLPVACVSWSQAKAYCAWEGGGTRRLPTEAEWEKASRGTDGRTYPWGNQNPNSLEHPCKVVTDDSCPPKLVPVGSTPLGASPYGAQDMSGNVWNWVSDWYDPNYYAAAPSKDPQGPERNPTGATDPDANRAYRGGGITDPAIFQRSSFRYGGPPGVYPNVGIRCARSVKR
jgi:formylglycine-generating enzyme required for sulfatase activity